MVQSQYNAYRAAEETAVGANQIPVLYEGAIRYMCQARDAIERKDYEARFNLVNKAAAIITGMRECLNVEEGSKDVAHVVQVLDEYYNMIDVQMLTLHSNDSLELCDMIISSLKQLHGAWKNVAAEYNRNSDISEDEHVELSEAAKARTNGNAQAGEEGGDAPQLGQKGSEMQLDQDDEMAASSLIAAQEMESSATYSSRGTVASSSYASLSASAQTAMPMNEQTNDDGGISA